MKNVVLVLLMFVFGSGAFASFDDKGKSLTRVVTGRVVAENGEAVPGASITILETGDTFFADLDGNFSLTLPVDKVYTISISTVGFEVLKVNTGNLLPFSQQTLPALLR